MSLNKLTQTGGRHLAAAGPPGGTPQAGDTYYDTTNNLLYVGNSTPVWVCITPQSATVSTNQTTTSTSYTDLATSGPAVTLMTGTKVLVTLSADLRNTGANLSAMGVAVSGATTTAAADTEALYHTISGSALKISSGFPMTVTAGSNTFTAKYKVAAGTGTFIDRRIIVQAIP